MKELKIGLFLLLLLVVLCVLTIYTYADETDEYIRMLKDSIPESLSDRYEEEDESSRTEGGGEGVKTGIRVPGFSDYLQMGKEEVKKAVRRPLSMLSVLLFTLLLSAIFRGLRGFIREESVGSLFDAICNICMTLAVFSCAALSIDSVQQFICRVADFCTALSPAMCALCASCGNIGSATVTHTGMAVCVSLCEKLISDCLLPLLRVSLALSVGTSVGGDIPDVTGIVKLFRGFFNTALGLLTVVFTAILSYQTWIGSASDSLASRTLRFTVGSSIPVVGTSIGEAMRTVAGSLTFLKSTIGGVGVSVVLCLLLPPLVMLLLDRACIGLGTALARLTGCQRESRLLEELGAFYGCLCACVCMVALMTILVLSLYAGASASAFG